MKIAFDWGLSDRFGWGDYGINLYLHGNAMQDVIVIPARGRDLNGITNPLLRRRIEMSLNRLDSVRLGREDRFLQALGNPVQARKYAQIRNFSVIFFENTLFTKERIDALKSFDGVIAGSRWNQEILTNLGIPTKYSIQGINTDTFTPQRKQLFKDRIVVFSGGKLEFRKGQDIAVKVFAQFIKRHSDALLIAAWSSPWDLDLMASVNRSNLLKPLENHGNFQSSVEDWLIKNHIPKENFLVLPSIPNELMGQIYAEVDIGLFPNRCEGGTNLVAMEALSCGVRVLLSINTGHIDLVGLDGVIPLYNQQAGTAPEILGWGESDADEILSELETNCGLKNPQFSSQLNKSMKKYSWENSIQSLVSQIK